MPRPRRPPGAGPALTFLALLLLPSILVAAQQQQPREHASSRNKPLSPGARVEHARIVPQHQHHHPQHPRKPSSEADSHKRHAYTPILSQNERALVTKSSSAPAISAVRARHGAGAASGVLAPSARSLLDWEVEDFVLLATVDGHIHARDRYNGEEIWEIAGRPMLETNYSSSDGRAHLQDQPFVWIVEPREDGALYVLMPGPYPVLQNLGLTVKQLTDIAPYSSDDPELPVVYNVEKRTFMLNIDAATGLVKQSFSPSGAFGRRDDDSCASPVKNFFNERDCRGTFEIGQTEYTISIHNKLTNEHVCTIKYAEWASNSRDVDLKSQYTKTLDDQYIYGRFDGEIFAYDHKRTRPTQRPVFVQRLPHPVARVFDVARPANDDSEHAPLVLLPQPAGPQTLPDKINHVLLNTTETGAWYALSELSYPAVTDGAPVAPIYSQDELLTLEVQHSLPADEKSLIGVHILDHRIDPQSRFHTIAAPTHYQLDDGQIVSIPPKSSPLERPMIDAPPQPIMHTESRIPSAQVLAFAVMFAMFISYAKWKIGPGKLAPLWSYLSEHWNQSKKAETADPTPAPVASKPEPEPVEEKKVEQLIEEVAASSEKVPEQPVQPVEPVAETPQLLPPVNLETKEKKVVTFDIPEDEDDLAPLSRTTTTEQASPDDEAELSTTTSNDETSSSLNATDNGVQDGSASPATPKKKKTHRGKRGGRKLNKNQPKDDDEVGRIVDAAKQLDPAPSLHPDEMTMNGDDMQDVTNIKRIGKLTIDQDRLLGNGSGGTFVFEGKWNVSILAKLAKPNLTHRPGTRGCCQTNAASILWAS